MNKNFLNKNFKIDLENGIVEDVLQLIKIKDIKTENSLIKVWVCRIKKSESKIYLEIINKYIIPFDLYNFIHLKRIRKYNDDSLEIIICSFNFFDSQLELENFIKEHSCNKVKNVYAHSTNVSIDSPETKEMSLILSNKYWPLNWKGNPYTYFFKCLSFDIKYEHEMIRKLLSIFEHILKKKKDVILVSIITNQNKSKKNKIISVTYNKNSSGPFDHSILKGIEKVSVIEKKKRNHFFKNKQNNDNNYLCNDLIIYTTHEPCVMCCMALVLSRIHRIIYMKEIPGSGGFESNFHLGSRSDLNKKFEIWKWIKKKDVKDLMELNNCAKNFNY